VSSGKELRAFLGDPATVVHFLAFTPDGKVLISGSNDTTVLLWDVASLSQQVQARPAKLTPDVLDKLWGDLGGDDAARAYLAVQALARAPEQAIPFFQTHLQKAAASDTTTRIDKLIAELDDDEFTVRESASKELEKLGRSAEKALRQIAAKTSSPEVRRRAEELLEKMKDGPASPDALRGPRAVEVLGLVGDAEARKLLETLAQGAPEAALTQEAKAALERLAHERK
jgi:hypothetical protein